MITKIDTDYAKKFLGNSEDSAYMLIYRKKNHPLPVLQTESLKLDRVIQRILDENDEIKQLRKNYAGLKQKVRLRLAMFSDLLNKKVITEGDCLRTLKDIPDEAITELIIDKTKIDQSISDIEKLTGKPLTDFLTFEVQVKHNNLIFYKSAIDWNQMISQSPESNPLKHGALVFMVEKNLSPPVTEFFDKLVPGTVR